MGGGGDFGGSAGGGGGGGGDGGGRSGGGCAAAAAAASEGWCLVSVNRTQCLGVVVLTLPTGPLRLRLIISQVTLQLMF